MENKKMALNLIKNQIEYMIDKRRLKKDYLEDKVILSKESKGNKPEKGEDELFFNVSLEDGFSRYYLITSNKEKWEDKGFKVE